MFLKLSLSSIEKYSEARGRGYPASSRVLEDYVIYKTYFDVDAGVEYFSSRIVQVKDLSGKERIVLIKHDGPLPTSFYKIDDTYHAFNENTSF